MVNAMLTAISIHLQIGLNGALKEIGNQHQILLSDSHFIMTVCKSIEPINDDDVVKQYD